MTTITKEVSMNIELIKENIYKLFSGKLEYSDIIIEKPDNQKRGDLAIPCFSLAKKLHQNPIEIANLIKESLKDYKIEINNGYVNIFLDRTKTSAEILSSIINLKENYGSNHIGADKTVLVEYSSPNIAKPFGVGHLRTTVIGASLYNIFKKNGYNVYGINYLGDYGTQFGKLIYAYQEWGNKEALNKDPLTELTRVYVQFHNEAEINPTIEDEGRKWFKKLEDNNPEALKLWQEFKEISLIEFDKIYKLLDVTHFDQIDGESNYKDKTNNIVTELTNKGLIEVDAEAKIVRLDDMTPAIISKNDGTSLYITRELACAIERYNHHHFDMALYVVGNEQSLHFEQLKLLLTKMGYDWSNRIKHINFGMLLTNGKKMSTRQGKSFKLEDLINEAINLANTYLTEKKSLLNDDEKKKAAYDIGIGAIIFNDLKNYRGNDIEFNLNDILKFEGNTGPYVQYTYARINSLLQTSHSEIVNYQNIVINEYMWNILFKLNDFPDIIIKAKENFDPSLIAKYLLDLCQSFNKMYANEKIIDNNQELTNYRLLICEAINIVIKEGMKLLGIKVLNKM